MVLAPWAVDLHAHLGSQNPKAILDIMVRDALDETGENFLRLILGRVFHYFEQPGCQGQMLQHAVSATVGLLRISAAYERWLDTRQCLCAVRWPTFRLPASGARESRTRASRSCDLRSKSIATASLAGNVCSSASSSSPSRWASTLEDALCGLCSIGMTWKTFFNPF